MIGLRDHPKPADGDHCNEHPGSNAQERGGWEYPDMYGLDRRNAPVNVVTRGLTFCDGVTLLQLQPYPWMCARGIEVTRGARPRVIGG